ncbi:glycoprotein-N-acetylgalactosamine 3-beta-galactosyltransferase 1-like [Crassostrea angulata]|uniref:glycoprotein-N-acetylgalactosamine 3-beta-galactosyltransferase 1-like n=1 Tax=Magallana angulata TaxID=2784310 RepID=UPI0022B0D651|nr:glycoprotein-N-acetylgalactosamine 3-beta-galactosyltransferase 1-like [Crassostrea angulata]
MHHGIQCAPFFAGVALGMVLYYVLFPHPLIIHIGGTSQYIREDEVIQRLLDTFYTEQEVDRRHLRDQVEVVTTQDKKILKMANNNTTIRKDVEDPVKIHCVVFINEHYGLRLATAVANTWGKRCSSLAFVGRALNQTTPYTIIHSNHSFYTSISDAQKVMSEAILYIKNKTFQNNDWFLFSTDTTFVILENLRLFLLNHTSLKPIYAGEISKKANGFIRPFQSGGIVFSKESLRALNVSSITSCTEEETYELTKGLCLSINGLIDVTPIGPHGQSLMNLLPVKLLMRTKVSQEEQVSPSPYTVSVRFLSSQNMYSYEMLVYNLNPYGINKMYM